MPGVFSCSFCGDSVLRKRRDQVSCGSPACVIARKVARKKRARSTRLVQVLTHVCAECGAAAVVSKVTHRFCSDACRAKARRRRVPDPRRVVRSSRRVLDARAKLRTAARGTRGGGTWIQGQCGECGDSFTRKGNLSPYCSKRCGGADRRRARRAAQAGVKITPGRRIAVFERDNWTCKLCDFPVNREADFLADDYPSIDHVVSLARGGEHGPDNWQTAHRLCNSYKRDLSMDEIAA